MQQRQLNSVLNRSQEITQQLNISTGEQIQVVLLVNQVTMVLKQERVLLVILSTLLLTLIKKVR
jgi:hypothetical protein